MEHYLWSAIGVVVFGAFVKVYWDVLQAYRSYRRMELEKGGGSSAGRAPLTAH